MRKLYFIFFFLIGSVPTINAQCLQDNVTINGNSYDVLGTSYNLCNDFNHAGIDLTFSSFSFGTPTLTVISDLTITANKIRLGKVNLVINTGVTLTIIGDLFLEDGATYNTSITVNGTGKLKVEGDFSTSYAFGGNGFNYDPDVGGDINITGDGSIEVTGDFNSGSLDPDNIGGNIDWTIDCTKVASDGDLDCTNIPGGIVDLPVELIYFQANLENDNVKLEWQTASEQNASHFDVQRSSDRKTWETLETISAAGNSQTAINYDYTDEEPLERGYYRLLQVDLDGANEVFGPIQVVQEGVEIPLELVIMPNELASGESVQFGISGLTEGVGINIQIFNGFGSLVYQENLENNTSKSLLKKMDFTDRLGTGIYYVVLTSGKKQVKEKLLIK